MTDLLEGGLLADHFGPPQTPKKETAKSTSTALATTSYHPPLINVGTHLWCFGCHKQVGFNIPPGTDFNVFMAEQGWRRRKFSQQINPWFCSLTCATESHWAKATERNTRHSE